MSKLIVLATAMTFAQATEVLAKGGMVKHKSWDQEFIFRVPKMQSLPSSVKAVFAKRFSELEQGRVGAISYDNQYAFVNENNEISGFSFDLKTEDTEWYEVTAESIVEKEEPPVTITERSTPAQGNEPAITDGSNINPNSPE